MGVLQLYSLESAPTLGVQAGLAGLVLGDLVHGVLLAVLVLAESALGLRNVHLHTQSALSLDAAPAGPLHPQKSQDTIHPPSLQSADLHYP